MYFNYFYKGSFYFQNNVKKKIYLYFRLREGCPTLSNIILTTLGGCKFIKSEIIFDLNVLILMLNANTCIRW